MSKEKYIMDVIGSQIKKMSKKEKRQLLEEVVTNLDIWLSCLKDEKPKTVSYEDLKEVIFMESITADIRGRCHLCKHIDNEGGSVYSKVCNNCIAENNYKPWKLDKERFRRILGLPKEKNE